jgi:hypothetical protein
LCHHIDFRLTLPSSTAPKNRALYHCLTAIINSLIELPLPYVNRASVTTMTLEPQTAPAPVPLSSKRPANDINSPIVRTPSRIATPPPPDRQRLQARSNVDGVSSKGSRHSGRFTERISINGVDPESLSRALSREVAADRRDSASVASPGGKRRRINGDRFVEFIQVPF